MAVGALLLLLAGKLLLLAGKLLLAEDFQVHPFGQSDSLVDIMLISDEVSFMQKPRSSKKTLTAFGGPPEVPAKKSSPSTKDRPVTVFSEPEARAAEEGEVNYEDEEMTCPNCDQECRLAYGPCPFCTTYSQTSASS